MRFHAIFSEALIKLARVEGVTLFTLLLAAWQTLLARYTEQTDIVVGSPIANRNRVETESLIGFFVNTLVLRTDCSGNPTFHELLERVGSVVLYAQANQDVPFEKIVEELRLERSPSHTPLFQVVCALHNAPAQATELPGLKLAWIDVLSETEERQLLYDWNEVAPHSEPERLLHELFEDQAERTPDNVALVLDDEKLTYRELNARANDLAQPLRELGVGPATLIGLFMERSIEMVIAVLGIIKSGGAYVPLDIEHPRERLAFMLDDARPPVLLTQRRLIDRLPELQAAQAVCIDELSSRDGVRVQIASGAAPLRRRGEGPAYVIYISGSTGTPQRRTLSAKGVGGRRYH